jgi:hypothetical protein
MRDPTLKADSWAGYWNCCQRLTRHLVRAVE